MAAMAGLRRLGRCQRLSTAGVRQGTRRAVLRPLALLLALLPLTRGQAGRTPDLSSAMQVPPDLACAQGQNAAIWKTVKQRLRDIIESPKGPVPGPFEAVPRDVLKNAIETSITEIQTVDGFGQGAEGECGMGKLCLQLLSLALIEDPALSAQSIQDTSSIASPVLTFILDMPWVSVALSGWPFFGILAQVSMNKVNTLSGVLNNDAVDGIFEAADREFMKITMEARQTGDLGPMFEAAFAYLAGSNNGGAYGLATAMATQLVIQSDAQKRAKGCSDLQDAIRGIIKTPRELELAMTTRWPLWSAIHIAVDAFAVS